MNNIAKNIRIERKKLGLNQAELATKVRVSAQAISQYERGETMPKLETLIKFSELFNYDLIGDKPLINNSNEDVTKNNQQPIGVGFKDVDQINQRLTYAENSTFPERDNDKTPQPEWRQLYNIQQQKINLLNREIELLNQLIQQ